MMNAKSRGGRPRRTPKPGERVVLGLRVTPDLKHQLDAAAELSGRSQSQEAEFRLERSFIEERSVGGPKVHSMTNMITATFAHAGHMHARTNGRNDWETGEWVDDPNSFHEAMTETIEQLLLAMPGGTPSPEHVQQTLARVYTRFMSTMINRGKWPNPYTFDKDNADAR
jgi:hypothetical protein